MPAGSPNPEKSQAPGVARGGPAVPGGAARPARDTRDALRDSLLVTQIDGMYSHRCEETIIRAVSALAGVREVEVDFASGQASVIFDARKVSSHQLIAAIEKAGYRCPDAAMPGENGGHERPAGSAGEE